MLLFDPEPAIRALCSAQWPRRPDDAE
jgi:hypothetical protein